jgi:diguanylate cyclase (GGDEF)-like protein
MTVSDDIARAARRPPAVAVRDHLARPLRRLVQALPHGGSLPDAAFWARHRLITVVVWLQLPLIAAVGAGGPNALGVGGGRSPAGHVLATAIPVIVFGMIATWPGFRGRHVRPTAAALALLFASSALVWLSGGLIEWHFHYFVVVAVVALYQDWTPFAIAVLFVLVSHGTFGLVGAEHVFDHAPAQQDPQRWAAFHAAFIAAECLALLAGWRQQERTSARAIAEEYVRREQAARRRVAEAVAADAPLDEIFRLAASEARELLGVELGMIARLEGEQLEIVCAAGQSPPASDRVPLSSGVGLSAAVRAGRPVRVDYRTPRAGDPVWVRVRRLGWRAAVAAPVRMGDDTWGAICATTTEAEGLPADSERRLDEFAALVGMAIRNAKTRARLLAQASTDPLTGLANRRAFTQRLAGEVERARRYGHPLALAILDLDDFKRVNDVHGHQIGDLVLARFAERLRENARPSDLVARLGGEEFAWLMPRTDLHGAVAACGRLLEQIGTEKGPEGVPRVTFSAGVAAWDDSGAAAMHARADQALYRAKAAGRARVFGSLPPDSRERAGVGT